MNGSRSDTNAAISTQPLDAVSITALAYLLLPTLVFLNGWLKPGYAVAGIALLIAQLRFSVHWAGVRWRPALPPRYLALIVALAAAWAIFGGAGHFFHANADWQVRDGVYGDLIRGGWPVSYAIEDGTHRILRSAIGYFLPPAALSKLLGLGVADLLLWIWTVIGAALFLLLLPIPWRTTPRVVTLLLVAILFSGMDAIGVLLTTGYWPIFPIRIEWWVPLSYTSLTGQLYWAPNHALPLWITTALFFRHWRHQDFPSFALPMLRGALIWTPFSVLGLAPFLVLLVVNQLRAKTLGRDIVVQLALTAILAYPVARYLTLDISQLAPTATFGTLPGGNAPPPPLREFLLHAYAPFVLMEFGILALLLHGHLRHSVHLFWIAVAVLASLPFLDVGPSTDTLLRVSTPALIILLILTLLALQEPWLSWKGSRIALVVVLMLGAVTPVHEIWRAATWRHTPPNYAACNLVERLSGAMPAHYIGKLLAPDLQALLRQPQLSPAGSPASPSKPCPLVDRARPPSAPKNERTRSPD